MKAADMHCDTIAELFRKKSRGEVSDIFENDLHLDLQKMKKGNYLLQNFALFTNLSTQNKPFQHAMELLDLFYMELEAYSDIIGIVTSYQEIEENIKSGKMSALLTIEEGGVCCGKLAYLRNFYRLGVRMMTFTWNIKNELGYPNQMIMDGEEILVKAETKFGLTQTGFLFLEEMEHLGMIPDISHLSDKGINQVLQHARKPVVASHSNSRSMASHPRNLTDDMIKRLSEKGGVAGVNYYADFLSDWKKGEDKISRISDMIRHMKHMKQVGGIECIGLGSDFDGIEGNLELKTAQELPLLEHQMKKSGFTEGEIDAVFYKNVMRVYREILT